MELKDNVLAIIKEVDIAFTERLNQLRDEFEAFYLTTDEILAYKDYLYSGYFPALVENLIRLYDEQSARYMIFDEDPRSCDYYLAPIYQKVRDRMIQNDVVMGKQLGLLVRKHSAPLAQKRVYVTLAEFVDDTKTELTRKLTREFDLAGLWFSEWNEPKVDRSGGIKKQADPKAPALLAEYEFLMQYVNAFALEEKDAEMLYRYGITSPTLLMCSTASDILNHVRDINFREQLFKKSPLILNGQIAKKLIVQKRASMPVWEGKYPEGEVLKMFKMVQGFEYASRAQLMGVSERNVQMLEG